MAGGHAPPPNVDRCTRLRALPLAACRSAASPHSIPPGSTAAAAGQHGSLPSRPAPPACPPFRVSIPACPPPRSPPAPRICAPASSDASAPTVSTAGPGLCSIVITSTRTSNSRESREATTSGIYRQGGSGTGRGA